MTIQKFFTASVKDIYNEIFYITIIETKLNKTDLIILFVPVISLLAVP
jgi:hypothetical protein